jgi:hypothetical protein
MHAHDRKQSVKGFWPFWRMANVGWLAILALGSTEGLPAIPAQPIKRRRQSPLMIEPLSEADTLEGLKSEMADWIQNGALLAARLKCSAVSQNL